MGRDNILVEWAGEVQESGLLSKIMEIPDDDDGSQADGNDDAAQSKSGPEQNAFKAVELPVGRRHKCHPCLIAGCTRGNFWAVSVITNGCALMADSLTLVDRGVGMIVAPVEPVVFQGGDAVETFALRWARDSAALEVPFAGGGAIE